jgi:hypothetical protein
MFPDRVTRLSDALLTAAGAAIEFATLGEYGLIADEAAGAAAAARPRAGWEATAGAGPLAALGTLARDAERADPAYLRPATPAARGLAPPTTQAPVGQACRPGRARRAQPAPQRGRSRAGQPPPPLQPCLAAG